MELIFKKEIKKFHELNNLLNCVIVKLIDGKLI